MSKDAPSPLPSLYRAPERMDVHGLDVAYRREGAGEPVLYLHGLGMTRRWLPFHQRLAERCDVIAPEHPGFGDTPLPEWLEGMDDLVIHYAELIHGLGLETLHLVGSSFGGWVAAELAVHYPERLRSLTLIAPMGVRVAGSPTVDVFRLSPDQLADAMFNGRAGARAEYVDEGDELETQLRVYAEMTALAKVAWNPRYDRKLDRRLERVACPALVIAAQEDRIVSHGHAARYAELLPHARLVTVEGGGHPTGHGIVAQAPDALAAEIARLITDSREGS